jgi:hypothetical protein
VERPTSSHGAVTYDDFLAYMPEHKYIFRPSREIWVGASVNARLQPKPLLNKHGKQVIDDAGNPAFIKATLWLDRNQPVEQLTWAPGKPEIIADRLVSSGGWIRRPGCHVANRYLPPTIVPGNPRAATLWVRHVHKLYGREALHIIRCLAHRVQRPWQKINHALVLGGLQGIGKDNLLQPVKIAVGPWNFTEISPAHLDGKFNGFVQAVILRISEAHDLGSETNRYAFYERLKTYTAAPPDVIRCNEKNTREYAVFNVCGVILTTNHLTDGMYLPADDRRHYVAWSRCKRADFTQAYWDELWDWYEKKGGYGHVAAYLAELDLSKFNPKAPPPKTEAWQAIVSANCPSEDAEFLDAIDNLARPDPRDPETVIRPDVITIDMLARNLPVGSPFRVFLEDRKSARAITHRLEAAGYDAVSNPGSERGFWRIGKRRVRVFAKRELSLKDQRLKSLLLVAEAKGGRQ